jgi:demethylmenaquinone methyltransferase/2-methoxy-6-polyprenyl-1,4-benzoquinol methylase
LPSREFVAFAIDRVAHVKRISVPTIIANSAAQTEQVDKSGERVRDMFAQIAGKYDLMNHLLSLNIDRYWRRETVRLVPPDGDDPILDVCTGTGDLAFAYRKAAPRVPITAADFCGEMLDVAKQKQARGQVAGIEFVEASTMDLPFDTDRFQIVSVAFGLRNVEDTDQGLREMVRVCRKGGRVAILEFSQPRLQPFKCIYNLYFRHVLPRIGQWMARNDKSAYEYLPSSVGQFPCGEELANRLRSVGLSGVTWRPMTFGIATLYWGTK